MNPALTINLKRLQASVEQLATYGFDRQSGGINRPSFSAADMQARDWLSKQFRQHAMQSRMDGVGNVFGRWHINDKPAVMLGSHLDSVPNGGKFDGALGVLAAFECYLTLKENGFEPDYPLEIMASSEEEGRFGGMLGSQALAGAIDAEWLENARDETGLSLREAMAACGLDYRNALTLKRRPDTLRAFLELHIEQGPVLEQKGIPVGIAEGISGVGHWSMTFHGRANHSGTTPMDMRADAFRGLAEFSSQIAAIIEAHGSAQSRITIGRVKLTPNFPHTIAGQANFSLIVRDMDEAIMQKLAKACRATAQEIASQQNLRLQSEQLSWLSPSACDARLMQLMQEQAERLNIPCLQMPSGAGHDTQFIGRLCPAGLLFVPSIGGVSHAPQEETDWQDIEKGCNVLLHTLMALLNDD